MHPRRERTRPATRRASTRRGPDGDSRPRAKWEGPGKRTPRPAPEPPRLRQPDAEADVAMVGRHAVREALRAGRPLSRILIQEGLAPGVVSEVTHAARERGIPVSIVPKHKLEGLAEGRPHQGLAALAAAAPAHTEAELESLVLEAPGTPFWLVLDGIQDPQNLGAILRVADGAGAHGIIIPTRGAVGLTAAVDKVSAGAASWVPVVRVVNIARTVERLKEWGLFVWAAVPDADRLYTEPDWTAPTALVIGGEGAGVRPLVQKRCDGAVRLPMQGHLASLNAATAAAVLAFEVSRRRLHKA
jgi:23S rRNA (guanosine2251-2'-O)-methyltransferase